MEAYFEVTRDLDKNFNFIINKDIDLAPHFHSNIEIIYVVSGCINVSVRGLQQTLTEGDIAIASGFEQHSFSTVVHSELHVWIFPTEMVPAFKAQIADKMFKTPFLIKCPRTDELLYNLNKLRNYVDAKNSLTATGYMYVILGILQEELGFIRRDSSRQSDLLIQKILMYTEEHFRENLSMSDMSKQFGYNPDYLSRIINSHIHLGFSRYINLLRARYAKNLIENSEMNLDEICFDAGFGCMKSFRRAFIDHYNQTPREYQKSLSGIRSK